jgi:ribosomal protein S18 acetylase RimI-like enzyme
VSSFLDPSHTRYDPISKHFLLSVITPGPPDTSLTSILSPAVNDKGETVKPIGTIRWTPSIGKVSRVTVLEEYRQYGFGRVLMSELEKFVAEKEDLNSIEDVCSEIDGKTYAQAKLHSQVRQDSCSG